MGLCGLQLKDDRSVTIILMVLHHRNDGTFCTVAALMERRYSQSDQSGFVQRQQLAPGAIRVGFVVNGLAVRLLRHVSYAPPVLRLRVHLYFGRDLRGGERFLQLGLRVRVLHVVICSDAEVHPTLDLRCEQVRAVRVRRNQASAVERSARAHAVRYGCCGLDHERSAHTVTLRADLFRAIDFLLRIEPHNERNSIAFGCSRRVDRSHQRRQFVALSRIAEVEVGCVLEHRRLGHPIEWVWHKHRIPLRRQPLGHVTHGRPEPKRIRPDQDCRVRTSRRVDESRIAAAVRGFDFNICFGDALLRRRLPLRRCGGNTRPYGYRYEVSSCDLVFHCMSSSCVGREMITRSSWFSKWDQFPRFVLLAALMSFPDTVSTEESHRKKCLLPMLLAGIFVGSMPKSAAQIIEYGTAQLARQAVNIRTPYLAQMAQIRYQQGQASSKPATTRSPVQTTFKRSTSGWFKPWSWANEIAK